MTRSIFMPSVSPPAVVCGKQGTAMDISELLTFGVEQAASDLQFIGWR